MRPALIRNHLIFCVSILFTLALSARSSWSQSPVTVANPLDARLDIATLPLWNATLNPEAATDTGLTVFYPQSGRSNGAAVVIAPGGAYSKLVMNVEGRQIADWFAARGFTAFILKYRIGATHPYPEPLLDGQRAIRLVRSMSAQFKIQPNKIGMVGFSAGGHLAAMVSTSFDEGDQHSTDPAQSVSDRPDFTVLGYPWINAMQLNSRGFITYCTVLKTFTPQQCQAWEQPYTPSLHVTASTPPTFIYSTTDDTVVPVSASVDYYSALMHAGAPAELHIFSHGPHGAGLGGGSAVMDAWSDLLENWLRAQHLL